MVASKELKLTSAADWRRPVEGMLLELPSGKVMKVRRTLDMFDMLKEGEIPNVLKGIVAEAITTGDSSKLQSDVMTTETLTGMIEFVNDTVVRMAIEPKVMKTPTLEEENKRRIDAGESELTEAEYPDWSADWWPEREGAIPLKAIELEDRMFMFQVSQGGTTDLATFREEAKRAVEPVPNVRPVPRPTKRTGGSTKRK